MQREQQQQQQVNSKEGTSSSEYSRMADDYNNTIPWYHGVISKELVYQLLWVDEDGLFLVRDSISYPGDFTLCVKFQSKIHEYRIKRYYASRITINDKDFFDSLEEVIESCRVKQDELCVALANYVVKERKARRIKSKSIHIKHSGSGEFGRSYYGIYNKRSVMLKMVSEVGAVESMLRKSVCHENLMNIIGLTKFDSVSYLVSAYSRYGTLLDLLRTWSKTSYVRKFAFNFCYDICSGMEYLEKKYIVHKYLAARNIWVTRNGIAKLSNFGLCEEYGDSYKHLPYRHFAPEVLIAQRYSHAADMWSFGVTLWEIFANGSVPYTDVAYYRILKLLRTGERLPKPRDCSGDMYETMKKCWQWKFIERPKFSDMRKKFDNLRTELCQTQFFLEI